MKIKKLKKELKGSKKDAVFLLKNSSIQYDNKLGTMKIVIQEKINER